MVAQISKLIYIGQAAPNERNTMTTNTVSAKFASDFHILNTREYRGHIISKAVGKWSGKQVFIFALDNYLFVGNAGYCAKTLKQAKVMIDYVIDEHVAA